MADCLRVSVPPSKPLMVYDGDCNFCTFWVRRWQHVTGETVDYLPAQDPAVAAHYPEISASQFSLAVNLIQPDGKVTLGAEAVFRTLAHNPRHQWPLRWYKNSPLFADVTEGVYRLVASHRTAFSRLTRWCWGRNPEPPRHQLTRWFFLRALGAVYLVAFLSLWLQISGLIGQDGILPAGEFLSAVSQQCDAHGIGWERYHLVPTLCWFDSSDAFLHFQCAAGVTLSALLIFDCVPAPCLVLLWVLYLSLATIGREFLGFQWDSLLLEAGFLAIFFAPLNGRPRLFSNTPPSRAMLWLLRLLLFKLMFSSGCVKLLSHDSNWRNLTALTYHYQTQPLPPWTAWYANQLPLWFQKLSCAGMFAIELGAPWLIFAPRRLRFLGAAALASLQCLIIVTGNYTFFNWLTLALCLLLLDDAVLMWLIPAKLRPPVSLSSPSTRQLRWPRPVLVGVTAVILPVSLFMLAATVGLNSSLFAPVEWAAGELGPLRTVNSYGLFAVMTTQREEIILEGSDDGVHWLPYEFKYKPGDVGRRPNFVAPFQPRLDWQMWFAALGTAQDNPWLVQCCEQLLRGSPAVLGLLAKNPFPAHPPRYIRAEFYDYRFTTPAERRATGAWWHRERVGEYLPPLSLRSPAAP